MIFTELNQILLAPYFPVIVNLVLGVLVAALCLKRGNWLLGAFLFSSFFFAYSIVPQFILPADEKHYWIRQLQPIGLHGVVVVFFLGLLLAAVISTPFNVIRPMLGRLPRLPVFALVLFFVSIPLAYWQHVVHSGGGAVGLAVRGMIVACGLTVIAFALTALARNGRRPTQYHWQGVYWTLFGALAFCTAIAFWEIASQSAWVANVFRDNLAEFRASATFRNPNLFGAWVAALALAAAYAAVLKVRFVVHPILALSAIAIFLSGSRTALMLALICLALPIALARYFQLSARESLITLVSFLSCLIVAIATPLIIVAIAPGVMTTNFSGFYALALRFVSLPLDVINYMSYILGAGTMGAGTMGAGTEQHIKLSIEGRLSGGLVDNGFLAMGGDGWVGYVSAVCWALFWLSLAWAGLKRLALSPSLIGVYAVTLLGYCIAIGFIMRAYQMFPIAAFVAILLSLFLLWFLSDESYDR